jgi:hypothetical protein
LFLFLLLVLLVLININANANANANAKGWLGSEYYNVIRFMVRNSCERELGEVPLEPVFFEYAAEVCDSPKFFKIL